jgi:hypothetical protein
MENMPIPKGLEIRRDGDVVVILRRPRLSLVTVPLLFLPGILCFVGAALVYYHPDRPHPLLFPPPVYLVLGTLYLLFSLWLLLLETELIVSPEGIFTVIRPFSLGLNRAVAARDICKLVLKEQSSQSRYRLMYVNVHAKEQILPLGNFRLRDQAEFVERSIRESLRLE